MFNQLNFSRMKRTLLLAGAALLALVACNKSQTVVKEAPEEITFKAVAGVATKGPEVSGTAFANDNVLKVAATTKEQPIYFGSGAGQSFVYDAAGWKASPDPVYWPAGQQRVDFLAYATKAGADLGVTPAFDATRPADKLTVADWDVYTKQVDFLYAAANNKYKDDVVSAVPMAFRHSTALIIFNFGVSQGPAIKIVSIDFDKLIYQGTFRVDNTKTQLSTRWYGFSEDVVGSVTAGSGLSDHNKTQFPAASAGTKSDYNTVATEDNVAYGAQKSQPLAYSQLGESWLVIPQERQSFLITYKIGADDTTLYTFHCDMDKGEWEAGKVYIYNIDFNLREIKITPEVVDWTAGVNETL